MKKYTCLLLVIFFFITCKKEKDKSLVELVDGTVWNGVFAYGGAQTVMPFSIEFDGVGNFKWFEVFGPAAGLYTIDEATKSIFLDFTTGGHIDFAFTVDGVEISEITNGPTAYHAFLYGALVDDAKKSLDNTAWEGTVDISGGTRYALKFLPGSKMQFSWGNNTGFSTEQTYARNQASIDYAHGTVIFGIIKGDSIIGIHDDGVNTYKPFRLGKK